MIGLRIGVGSLGFLCLSAALVMVLEQIGALSGFGGELALVALAIGVGGASLWLIWQMAPRFDHDIALGCGSARAPACES